MQSTVRKSIKCEGKGYSSGEQPSKCKNITVKRRGAAEGISTLKGKYTCRLGVALGRERNTAQGEYSWKGDFCTSGW